MKRFAPYALGAGIVGAVTLLKLVVPGLAEGTPFLLFFGAVLATAWRGGAGPGAFSALVGAVMSNVFFMQPSGALTTSPRGLAQTAVFLAESGAITYICVRLRAARADARRAEDRARELLVDAPVGIFVLEGPDNTITFANAAYRDLVGVEQPEGRPFRDVLPAVAALGVEKTFDDVRRTGRSHTHQEFRTCRDWRGTGVEEERFFDFTSKRVGSGTETVMVALLEVTHEVRARREVEKLATFREAERTRVRNVLERAPTLMGTLDGPEHTVAWANEAFRTLFAPRGELVGRTLSDVLPDILAQGFGAILAGVYANGERWCESAVSVTLAEGDPQRFFNVDFEPVRDERGTTTGIFVLANEVTELVVARERAIEASRLKDEFLGTLSHELRTPLNAIIGWSSLLREGKTTGPQTTRALETIDRNARVQVRLIEDLLDVSRIVQGKLVLNVVDADLPAVIDAAIEALRPAADAKQIRVRADVEAPLVLRGDEGRLQQITWNLLANAIKFTPSGGNVTVSLHRAGPTVQLAVTDDGEGIAPEFLPHVFDRFRQADSSNTRRHGGLGLGLAIVRSLVELHGGTISASSEGAGKGSRFVVELPAPETTTRVTDPPARAAAIRDAGALSGLRVMCVDDEEDARVLVRHLLEACGAEVTCATSTEDALEKLDGGLDILVSDVGLPGKSGLELIREVRAGREPSARNVPALALTAYARSEDRSAALRAGYDLHASKPVDPSELVILVTRLARLRRS